jgi:hypothetical protein
MKKNLFLVFITTWSLFALGSAAHPLSEEECTEGSDFIRNVALARENGMDGMTFVAKTLADFQVIRSFPSSLRWFAQDREDEDYLLTAVTQVFESPIDPQLHQRAFLLNCLSRSISASSGKNIPTPVWDEQASARILDH